MRAKDFLPEEKTKVRKEHENTFSPGVSFPSMNGYYEYYRFGNMVAAEPNDHVDSHHEHFDDSPTAFAYTPEELNMLKNSAKRMGKKIKHITSSKSSDPRGTNAKSPIPHNSGRKK